MLPRTPQNLDHLGALLERSRQGDEAAFTEFVATTTPILHQMAFRILRDHQLAEDAAQIALYKLWKALPRFDRQRNGRNWALTVVSRVAISLYRVRKTRREHGRIDETIDYSRMGHAGPAEANCDIDDLIRKLPCDLQRCVELFYLRGVLIRELAEILRIPIGTVASRLHRARRRLRQMAETR